MGDDDPFCRAKEDADADGVPCGPVTKSGGVQAALRLVETVCADVRDGEPLGRCAAGRGSDDEGCRVRSRIAASTAWAYQWPAWLDG
jgi:hypothetical protein